jgi:hypothetical protein
MFVIFFENLSWIAEIGYWVSKSQLHILEPSSLNFKNHGHFIFKNLQLSGVVSNNKVARLIIFLKATSMQGTKLT